MVKTCANPACAAPFRYFRGGKLFRFDVKSSFELCLDVTDQRGVKFRFPKRAWRGDAKDWRTRLYLRDLRMHTKSARDDSRGQDADGLVMMLQPSEIDDLKRAAAQTAVSLIKEGMIVGLGTGSTAAFALSIIAQRVADGLEIIGIPTSEKVEQQARSMGIPLSTLAKHEHIDIAIDGADEVQIGTLNLIKGRGGALLREKIVATAADQLIIVVDDSKLVDRLGVRDPVPLEVVPFGWQATAKRLQSLVAGLTLRLRHDGQPFISDGGHYILDCVFGATEDPVHLQQQLDQAVGVVENGLFLGLASQAMVGSRKGVSVLHRERNT
jgi:ribose 5-phosphate isomerase A